MGKPDRYPTRLDGFLEQRSFFGWFRGFFGDWQTLAKLVTIVITALVVCVITQSWDPPFEFRLGDAPDRNIDCTTRFSIFVPLKTQQARLEARLDALHVYVNDPSRLTQFKAQLINTVQAVITAPSFDEMSPEVRALWAKFLPPGTEDADAKENFALFQTSIEERDADESGDAGLKRLMVTIDEAFRPFETNGILLKLHGIREGNQERVLVYDAGSSPESAREVWVNDILIGNAGLVSDLIDRDYPQEVSRLLMQWIRSEMVETLSEDPAATLKEQNKAEAEVQPVEDVYEPGQTLLKAGHPIDQNSFDLLRKEYRAMIQERSAIDRGLRFFGVFGFLFVVLVLVSVFMHMGHHRDGQLKIATRTSFFFFFLLMMVTIGLGRLIQVISENRLGNPEIIPLLIVAAGFSIAFSLGIAISSTLVIILTLTLSGSFDLTDFLTIAAMSSVVICVVHDLRRREQIVYSAAMGGLVALILTLMSGLFRADRVPIDLFPRACFRFFWAIVAGFMTAGLQPFIERWFHILTPIRLMELGNPDNPLLARLKTLAPATYTHSVNVSEIASAAARAIGARDELVRVGALYHDIGKMTRPEYFTENLVKGEESPHAKLRPQMSAQIIANHVYDGVEIARSYKLPQEIIDLMAQHHGTTFAGRLFYENACKQAEGDASQMPDEKSFRYRGPKPQTRETGILMLSDIAESACRSLPGATPEKIHEKIHGLVKERMDDGSLDETCLTVGEVRQIENSLINSIIAIQHKRIPYTSPESQRPADKSGDKNTDQNTDKNTDRKGNPETEEREKDGSDRN
ncbi:MAG: HDIG domain-containing protein [Thermoguttaceae bacterium]|nr:HDIG domain-containing protein [Thermoguttaceae bacterium]